MLINSQEIDKYIHNFLLKSYMMELKKDDLDKVKNIVLSKYNVKHEIVEYDYSDLSKLSNLEKCSIEFLEITDELINNINMLKNLRTLEFNSCEIKTVEKVKNNLNKILLQNMEQELFLIFEGNNIETIEVIDFKNIDLSILSRFTHLKNLYIYNSSIINFSKILDMKSVEVLKLDGSEIDDEVVFNMISKSILVQKNEKFLLANATLSDNGII